MWCSHLFPEIKKKTKFEEQKVIYQLLLTESIIFIILYPKYSITIDKNGSKVSF
jgi:hypothetical protein